MTRRRLSGQIRKKNYGNTEKDYGNLMTLELITKAIGPHGRTGNEFYSFNYDSYSRFLMR